MPVILLRSSLNQKVPNPRKARPRYPDKPKVRQPKLENHFKRHEPVLVPTPRSKGKGRKKRIKMLIRIKTVVRHLRGKKSEWYKSNQ